MTLTLQLPPEIEKKLLCRAAQTGQRVESIALQIIEQAVMVKGDLPPHHAGDSFNEILHWKTLAQVFLGLAILLSGLMLFVFPLDLNSIHLFSPLLFWIVGFSCWQQYKLACVKETISECRLAIDEMRQGKKP